MIINRFITRFIRCQPLVFCALAALSPVALFAQNAPLRWHLAGGHENWPAAERQAIINAMNEAVALYNQHGHFEKTVWANFNPSVPTAQANYDGWIEFGNLANMNTRVALHEVSHTLGIGTHWAWNQNRSGNTWTGQHAIRQLRHFDGPTAALSADGMHFWPYGLNFNPEDGPENRVRHIKMVAAMRRDMGIVPVHNGVPADWQMFHFGFVDQQAAATRDFDGDGFTDLDEYLAFTDPTDPISYTGAPLLFYHWPLNETAATSGMAQLDPAHQPVGNRRLSAPLAGAVGRGAFFVKGADLAQPGPVFSGPAAKGGASAGGSTGSIGAVYPGARFDLGNVIPGNQPFTLSLWFRRNGSASMSGLADTQHIVSGTDGAYETWHLHARNIDASSGAFDLGFYHRRLVNAGEPPLVAASLRSDTWYHLAITRDEQDRARVYVDGQERFAGSVASLNAPFLAAHGPDHTAGNTVAWWRFEEGPIGARVASPQLDVVIDASGNGNHLRTWDSNTAPIYATNVPFSPVPRSGAPNQLSLNFSGGNRDLYSAAKPINTHPFRELTVEASFNADAVNAYQVIVGKDGNPIGGQPPFSLKIRANGLLEGAIADGGGARRQVFSRETLRAGVWYSAAVSMTATEMSLWLKGPGDTDYILQNTTPINGLFAPINTSWTIGRGMWNGGHADRFNGFIDEARVTEKALGSSRLFLGHDARMDATHTFLGFFDDVRIYHGALPGPVVRALIGARPPNPPEALSSERNSFGQNVIGWSPVAGAERYIIKRSAVAGGPYTVVGETTNSEWIDAEVAFGATYYYVVSSVGAHGESANSVELAGTVGWALHLHLPFDETSGSVAADASRNGWHGALHNGASWTPRRRGNAISLNGNQQHVSLPTGVTTGLADFTIAAWVRLDAVATWSRIFDFGAGTNVNMFLTPQASDTNAVRFAITTGGSGSEQRIDSATVIPIGRWTHVAVTLGGRTGTLYINGVAVGVNHNMTLRPEHLGNTGQNWLGRSQWPDPFLNGLIDDFQIIRGALTASQVQSLMNTAVLPPTPPVGLESTGVAPGGVRLIWQAVAEATSYTVWRAESVGGPFFQLAGNLTGTEFTDATASSGEYFYVVSAVNAAGESYRSAKAGVVVSVAPIDPSELMAPAISLNDGSVILRLRSAPGRTYQLQRSADLASGNWVSVGAITAGTGGEINFVDTFGPESPRMFYRVLIAQ